MTTMLDLTERPVFRHLKIIPPTNLSWFTPRPKSWKPVSSLDTHASIPVVETVQPAKLLEIPEWHALAACAGKEDKQFFGVEGVQPSMHTSVLRETRALCRTCPVEYDCLLWALTKPEKYGVWAGTTGKQRTAMHEFIDTADDRQVAIEKVIDVWLTR